MPEISGHNDNSSWDQHPRPIPVLMVKIDIDGTAKIFIVSRNFPRNFSGREKEAAILRIIMNPVRYNYTSRFNF